MKYVEPKMRLAWSYLVGVYLGDGCVTKAKKQSVFRMDVTDKDFADATVAALRTLTNRPIERCVCLKDHPIHKPQHSIRCRDVEISADLQQQTKFKAEIPQWIFDASRDERLAFLAGLMDSEGYVCMRGDKVSHMGFKSTDDWFYQFVELLTSLGIEVGRIGVERPLKPGYRTPRRIGIPFRPWIDAGGYFNIRRKQEKVEAWADSPIRRRLRAGGTY